MFLQLQMEQKVQVVDKKQSEFSLKKMIKRLHIKEPAEHVMAILGRKWVTPTGTHVNISGIFVSYGPRDVTWILYKRSK